MRKNYLIGLDLGTSAVKGILISTSGEVIASCDEKTEFITDEEKGCIEYDIDEYFAGICRLIGELAANVTDPESIMAVSMAAASGNSLLADEQGRALTNVISWMDRRATSENCATLAELHKEDVHEIVGWPAIPSFPLASYAWFKENCREQYAKVAHFAMNTDYVIYRMTGKWAMDYSTGTTFYLQDQKKRTWHKPFLEILEIREECLPELAPSGTPVGNLTGNAAHKMGLTPKTTVVLGAFDHPSAARGTGTLDEGQLLLSCGTSWVGFYPTLNRELPISLGLLVDPFLSPDGPWGTMFSLPCIGVTIDWYVDNLIAPECKPGKERMICFDRLAMGTPPGAARFFVDPMIPAEENAETVEQCREKGPALTARALMEGAVYRMKHRMAELADAGLEADKIVMVGGPSKSPIWPQILADVTGAELRMINGQHAGAFGAALLAGIGVGIYPDERTAFQQTAGESEVILPDCRNRQLYESLYKDFIEKT